MSGLPPTGPRGERMCQRGCPMPHCFNCISDIRNQKKRRAEFRKYLPTIVEEGNEELAELWCSSIHTVFLRNLESTTLSGDLIASGLMETMVRLIARSKVESVLGYALDILIFCLKIEKKETGRLLEPQVASELRPRLLSLLQTGSFTDKEYVCNVLKCLGDTQPKFFLETTTLPWLADVLIALTGVARCSLADFVDAGELSYQESEEHVMKLDVYQVNECAVLSLTVLSPYFRRLMLTEAGRAALPDAHVDRVIDSIANLAAFVVSLPVIIPEYPESVITKETLVLLYQHAALPKEFDAEFFPDQAAVSSTYVGRVLQRLAQPAALDKLKTFLQNAHKQCFNLDRTQLRKLMKSRIRREDGVEFDAEKVLDLIETLAHNIVFASAVVSALSIYPPTARAVVEVGFVPLLLSLSTEYSKCNPAWGPHNMPPEQLKLKILAERIQSKEWTGADGTYIVGVTCTRCLSYLIASLLHLRFHLGAETVPLPPAVFAKALQQAADELKQGGKTAGNNKHEIALLCFTMGLWLTLLQRDDAAGKAIAADCLASRAQQYIRMGLIPQASDNAEKALQLVPDHRRAKVCVQVMANPVS